MDLDNSLLQQTVEETWEAMFALEVEKVDGPIPHHLRQSFLTATIQVAGEWVGAVMIDFSPTLARQLTGTVLEVPPETVNLDQMRDVLGEVANIVGGNLKQNLPENSVLALPTLVFGLDYRLYMPDAEPVNRVTFKCQGESFQATVFHVASADAAAGGDVTKLLA